MILPDLFSAGEVAIMNTAMKDFMNKNYIRVMIVGECLWPYAHAENASAVKRKPPG